MAESAVLWFEARSGTMLWVRSSRSLRRFEFLISLKVVESGGKSVYLPLDRVKEDLELEGVVNHSPAIAWVHSGNKGVALELCPEVSDADT
jgi:hypothetical protein